MRALVTADAALTVLEVPVPTPAESEALVSVGAASINRGEVGLISRRPSGWRGGQDVAGVIARAAADGTGPPEGTAVVAWVDQGGWAEYVAAPTDRVVPLPEGVPAPIGATLPIAGVTALRALRRGGLLLGRRVLVTGAAGGVGRFAVELAARAGADVSAVAQGPDRAAGLADIGASEIVNQPSEAAGRFDLILESAGGASLAAMPALLARDGVLVVFGNSAKEASTLSFWDFTESPDARLEILRVYDSREAASKGEDLARLVTFVARGWLHPLVGLEIGFEDANQALAALEERRVNGKAILRFDRNAAA